MHQSTRNCSDSSEDEKKFIATSSTSCKTVGFSRKVKIFLIPTVDEYTDEERSRAWRTEEDERTSERDTVDTINLIREHNGHIPDSYSNSTTIRGLEKFCSGQEFLLLCRKRREDCIQAVLDMQDYQWTKNDAPCYDTESEVLRAVATQCSADATRLAISFAEEDAAYVRRQQKHEK